MPDRSFAAYVSRDYRQARERFRAAVTARNARWRAFPLPGGNDLTLDVARVGPENGRLVIVSSGLHGSEAAFGSAVQLAVLDRDWPPDTAFLFLHVLNPFGFANGRRTDADNIDLNRNFLLPGETYAGSPANFERVDGLLNPRRGPLPDFFPLRLWWARLRLGDAALRQAVAGGQYVNPAGLFFGGAGPSALFRLLDSELTGWVDPARSVIHLDFHTGLGQYGRGKLLIASAPGSERHRRWVARFGDGEVEACGGPTAYANRGGFDEWIEAKLAGRTCDSCCAEFGTFSPLAALSALRAENQAWFFARNRHADAARRMLATFVPDDQGWADAAVRQGTAYAISAAQALLREG
jgi:hypothetical protein